MTRRGDCGAARRNAVNDGWDPAQYGTFAAERAQPFWDLVALLEQPAGGFGRCRRPRLRPGELTAAVTERLGIEEMVGIDSSERCSARRGRRSGAATTGCASPAATSASGRAAATTTSSSPTPACSGCPTTPACSPAGGRRWRPGGQLAVQVPANADHPSHRIAAEVAATEPFLSAIDGLPPPDPVAANVLAPEQYAIVLDQLGAVDQHVRLQVYPHHLESIGDVVEWVQGHVADPLHQAARPDLAEPFVDAYRASACSTRIGDVAPYFYPFKRILIWAGASRLTADAGRDRMAPRAASRRRD